MARINLVLPDKTKDELEQLAGAQGIGVQELIRDYIGIGFQIETILEEGGEVYGQINEQKFLLADPDSLYIKKIRG